MFHVLKISSSPGKAKKLSPLKIAPFSRARVESASE